MFDPDTRELLSGKEEVVFSPGSGG